MKSSKFLSILFAFCMLTSCEKSLKEKIEQTIVESEGVEMLPTLLVVDTISVKSVEDAKEKYESSLAIFEEQTARIPQQIEATKLRIDSGEIKMKSAPKMLQSFWQETINAEKENLINSQKLLTKAEKEIEFIKTQMDFVNQALAEKQDTVAYYMAETVIDEKPTRFYVTPTLKIIKKEN